MVTRNCIILKHDIYSSGKPSKMVLCVYLYKIKQGPICKHLSSFRFLVTLYHILSECSYIKSYIYGPYRWYNVCHHLVWDGVYKIAIFKPRLNILSTENDIWYQSCFYIWFFVVFLHVFKQNWIHTIGFWRFESKQTYGDALISKCLDRLRVVWCL